MTSISDNLVVVRQINASETIPLRHGVLWPHLSPLDVILAEDVHGLHFGAFLNPQDQSDVSSSGAIEPIAVISFFLESLPEPPGEQWEGDSSAGEVSNDLEVPACGSAARFRKFATADDYQSRGIGSRLLREGIVAVKRVWPHVSSVWCDARLSTSDWYRKRGMRIAGHQEREGRLTTFWKGGVEYVRMTMDL